MTSKLTREQLHERARENVKALKMASRQTAFESAREEILADLQLAELALAAMAGEPVAWRWRSGPDKRWHLASRGDLAGEVEPLYRHAQPATASELLAVTDDELNAALHLHRLKVDGHSQLSDAFRAGFRYARRTTPQPALVVPDELNTRTANDIMNEHLSWKDYGDAEVFCIAWNACRAAMLNGGKS